MLLTTAERAESVKTTRIDGCDLYQGGCKQSHFKGGDQPALVNAYYSGGSFLKLPIHLLLASTLALTVSCTKASPEASASGVTPAAGASPTLSTSPASEGNAPGSSTAQGSSNAPGSGTAQGSSTTQGSSTAQGSGPATDSYHPVQVPSGTAVSVRLQSSISSASAQLGDRFKAVLDSPLRVGGQTVAAAGSKVTGRVVAAEHSGRLEHPGFLQLELSSINAGGREVAISTSKITAKGASHKKRNMSWIGGGAGGGALLGGLMGGGKGALIGSAAGAGAGTATAAATGKHDVAFNVEHQLTFRLRQQVEIP